MRQELVQWRIEETNRGRISVQRFENSNEVFPLIGQKFGQCLLAIFDIFGKDHLTHGINAAAFKEHMFGSAQSDTRRPEGNRIRCLLRRIGICPDLEARDLGAPIHQLFEHPVGFALLRIERLLDQHLNNFGRRGFDLAWIHFTRCAIDGKIVAFAKSVALHTHGLRGVIDL